MTPGGDVIFISGANAPYARCLYQLLRSAERHGAHEAHIWVVYDIGLERTQRRHLAARFDWCQWRDVSFAGLPPHVPPERGSYAWKPHVIREAAREFARPVIWHDSANLLKAQPSPMIDLVRGHGVFVLRGQTSLMERCEPAVLRTLAFPGRLRTEPECVTTAFGIDPAWPDLCGLLDRWHAAAMDPELITPGERTIERHMFEQALLSALLLPVLDARERAYPRLDVDISSGSPVRYLSTRNKLGPAWPWWTDPLARFYYATWKAADQGLIRRRIARQRRRAEAACTACGHPI